jgi:co-chaperonin GroES (HSP10)
MHLLTEQLQLQFKAVKPVGDRVLVKVGKEETKTAGGLLLPSSAQQKPLAGDIVSAGAVQHVKVGHCSKQQDPSYASDA